MKKLIIWYNPNRDVYYHKFVDNWSNYCPYAVGYVNSYGHIIVYVLDTLYEPFRYKESYKKQLANKLISFLKKVK